VGPSSLMAYMVCKITGKLSSSPIRHLKVNNTEVSDFPDIANTIAQTFSNNSSPEKYSNKFQSFRRQAENQQLKFKSNNYENYNNPFSLDELTDAISKSHDTTVGPDDVHYQMLKHLPNDALLILLNILNNIWASGKFPTSWCTSTVIPVPKPGKDTSYLRMLDPIQNHALSLCLGAYRTSPASSLCVEANEPALYFRRKKTRVIHVCKINDSLTGGQLHYDWNKITVSLG